MGVISALCLVALYTAWPGVSPGLDPALHVKNLLDLDFLGFRSVSLV